MIPRSPLSLSLSLLLLFLVTPAPCQEARAEPVSRPAAQDEGLKEKAERLLKAVDEVSLEVEALAGARFKKKVDSRVHDEKELTEFLKKKIFEEEMSEGRLERTQYLLRRVGLIPEDMDLAKEFIKLLVSQVGGFYDPDRGKFFMMLKSAKMGEMANRTVMAHELTHALDDQLFDLKRFTGDKNMSEDEGFASGSVIEGSATALMLRWTMKNRNKFDQKEMLESQKDEMEKSMEFFTYPEYFQTLVAKYYIGLNFLAKGEGLLSVMQAGKEGLRPNIAHAFKHMPQSSEQILHPYKYWDEEAEDLPVRLVDEKSFEESQGLKVIGHDTLGELLCGILGKPKRRTKDKKFLAAKVQLMAQPKYWIHKSGRGWGGDRVFIVGPDKKKPEGMVWMIWWDEKKDVAEFLKAYKLAGGKGRDYGVATEGKLCVLTYGSLQGEEAKILAGALAAPVQKGKTPFQVRD